MASDACFYVLKPGLFSSIQDLGRQGYRAFGVPKGGAMDRFSAKAANWLVGNPLSHPVLEITLMGPVLQFTQACQIAICGAHLSPVIDEQAVPLFQTLNVARGETLRFGKCISGCRAYLAIGGKWQLPNWLGSFAAAYPDTKKITPEQVLYKGQSLAIEVHSPISTRSLPEASIASPQNPCNIALLPGPEYLRADPFSIGYFFSHSYKVSPESNRMGFKLLGPNIAMSGKTEQISSGVMPGTLQITRSGQPIVLMADAQTTGGYPRIAQVSQASMDKLGQVKPGERIRFYLQSQQEALLDFRKRWEWEQSMLADTSERI